MSASEMQSRISSVPFHTVPANQHLYHFPIRILRRRLLVLYHTHRCRHGRMLPFFEPESDAITNDRAHPPQPHPDRPDARRKDAPPLFPIALVAIIPASLARRWRSGWTRRDDGLHHQQPHCITWIARRLGSILPVEIEQLGRLGVELHKYHGWQSTAWRRIQQLILPKHAKRRVELVHEGCTRHSMRRLGIGSLCFATFHHVAHRLASRSIGSRRSYPI